MFSPFDLTGKVALVTGGNSGIGLGMAEGLARAGASVAIWGRSPEKNADAAARLETLGAKVLALSVDVGSQEQIAAAFAGTLGFFGRVDFVAANAGTTGNVAFEDLSTDELRRITTINLDAVIWTFQEAVQHMRQRAEQGDPGGSLAVTSSTSAFHGTPRNEIYAATKAGVIAVIRGLAVEYARYGVRANAIIPGWVRSEMTAVGQSWDKFNERVINGRVPLRRWGEPEDFSGIAIYLASDASRFHTGDTLVLDGGYTIF